jgi:hypothetical protein
MKEPMGLSLEVRFGMKKTAGICLLGLFLVFGPSAGQEKTLKNAVALISDSDIHCSFSVIAAAPALKIAASEQGGERMILGMGDLFYINIGPGDVLQAGGELTILEMGGRLDAPKGKKSPGLLAYKRGRAKIVRLDAKQAVARVEKSCGPVMVGNSLLPYQEREGVFGHDLGYAGAVFSQGALSGRIIFMDNEFVQIAQGQLALIDLGTDQGIQFGQQLTVFHLAEKIGPPEAVGNVIVVDAGRTTSAIKVLSAKDAVRLDDIVQVK